MIQRGYIYTHGEPQEVISKERIDKSQADSWKEGANTCYIHGNRLLFMLCIQIRDEDVKMTCDFMDKNISGNQEA